MLAPASKHVPTRKFLGPFSRRSTPAYALLLIISLAAALLVRLSGLSFDTSAFRYILISAVVLLTFAWALRAARLSRTADALEGLTLSYLQGFVFLFIIFPLASLSGHYADDWLAGTDSLFGFHWAAFSLWISRLPNAPAVLGFAYSSSNWQLFLVIPVLAFSGHEMRMWSLVVALGVGAVVTSAIFPFFPAEGAFLHSRLPKEAFASLLPMTQWRFGPIVHLIKDDHVRFISQSMVSGLISFPSYHTVMALLVAWSMWPLRLLRWPFLVLNLLMIVAAIPLGAHYLTDIIGGFLVAPLSVWLACFAMDTEIARAVP